MAVEIMPFLEYNIRNIILHIAEMIAYYNILQFAIIFILDKVIFFYNLHLCFSYYSRVINTSASAHALHSPITTNV